MGGLAALLVSVLGGGCLEDPDKACGPGLVYKHKICADPGFFELIDGPSGDGDEGDGDGDVQTSDSGTDAASSAGAVLGEFCNKDGDCAESAPYCAKQPGYDGYCTIIGCDLADPSAVCPAGWRCFDVALVAGTGPKMCVRPTM
jgi:hypothetical protein